MSKRNQLNKKTPLNSKQLTKKGENSFDFSYFSLVFFKFFPILNSVSFELKYI